MEKLHANYFCLEVSLKRKKIALYLQINEQYFELARKRI